MMFRRSMTTRTAPAEFHPAVAGLCCFDHVSAPIRHSIFALTISRLSEKAVVCCNTRCSQLNSQFSVEVGRVVEDAVFHYEGGFSYVADFCRGISVDHHQIGKFSRRYGAKLHLFS